MERKGERGGREREKSKRERERGREGGCAREKGGYRKKGE